jgi:hypothetical protein
MKDIKEANESDFLIEIGTIEPIFDEFDNKDIVGFVRGFVRKYRNTYIPTCQIFEYLDTLTKIKKEN